MEKPEVGSRYRVTHEFTVARLRKTSDGLIEVHGEDESVFVWSPTDTNWELIEPTYIVGQYYRDAVGKARAPAICGPAID